MIKFSGMVQLYDSKEYFNLPSEMGYTLWISHRSNSGVSASLPTLGILHCQVHYTCIQRQLGVCLGSCCTLQTHSAPPIALHCNLETGMYVYMYPCMDSPQQGQYPHCKYCMQWWVCSQCAWQSTILAYFKTYSELQLVMEVQYNLDVIVIGVYEAENGH